MIRLVIYTLIFWHSISTGNCIQSYNMIFWYFICIKHYELKTTNQQLGLYWNCLMKSFTLQGMHYPISQNVSRYQITRATLIVTRAQMMITQQNISRLLWQKHIFRFCLKSCHIGKRISFKDNLSHAIYISNNLHIFADYLVYIIFPLSFQLKYNGSSIIMCFSKL